MTTGTSDRRRTSLSTLTLGSHTWALTPTALRRWMMCPTQTNTCKEWKRRKRMHSSRKRWLREAILAPLRAWKKPSSKLMTKMKNQKTLDYQERPPRTRNSARTPASAALTPPSSSLQRTRIMTLKDQDRLFMSQRGRTRQQRTLKRSQRSSLL